MQDSIGVVPLNRGNATYTPTLDKAGILNEQFCFVFRRMCRILQLCVKEIAPTITKKSHLALGTGNMPSI